MRSGCARHRGKKFDIILPERYNEGAMDEKMKDKRPFIIGLTGNIGSGKSTVLNMLRHMGAYGIDADELTKKAYQDHTVRDQIESRIGHVFTAKGGDLDRRALARIVFHDAPALAELEAIIHPWVARMAGALVRSAHLPIIAIEAIKLLESDLAIQCDRIWVVEANNATITARLKNMRGMRETEIQARLANQSPIEEKVEKADTVVRNSGGYKKTWNQISQAWERLAHEPDFRTSRQRTETLISPFRDQIVSPFSAAHMHIRQALDQGDDVQLTPGGKVLSHEKLETMICGGFVLADGRVVDARHFTGWNLSTFSLSMQTILSLDGTESRVSQLIDPGWIENLAKLHRVERLMLPMRLPFYTNSDSVLIKSGFKPVGQDDSAAAYWAKAGYNVFYKHLRDAHAYK